MNVYKVSTIILGIIVVIQTTVLSIDLSRSRVAELSKKEFEFLKENLRNKNDGNNPPVSISSLSKNTYINTKTALEALSKFKKRQGIFYRVKKRAYGHYFDLETIDEFRIKVNEFNDKVKKGEMPNRTRNDTINGIRVYRSRNDYKYRLKYKNPDSKPDTVFIKYDDIFLIPTYGKMKNLFPIDRDYDKNNLTIDELYKRLEAEFIESFGTKFKPYLTDDEPIILNASIPCPNNCDQN